MQHLVDWEETMKVFTSIILLFTINCALACPCDDNESIAYQPRLESKVAIVVGASKGIGRAIAMRLANERAQVVAVSRNESLLKKLNLDIARQGGQSIYLVGDVSKEQDMRNVVQETIKRYGKVDILVQNAGIHLGARLEDLSTRLWDKVVNNNLRGTFFSVKSCLTAMQKQNHGRIVLISSISGPRTGLVGQAHYTASKAGINGFMRTAAIELAKHNVTINAVEPGVILTEGLKKAGSEKLAAYIKAIPMGRVGVPEDIAGTVAFLVSRDARFITGQSIIVDGGQVLPESHYIPY